jgi:hypothetical protein
MKLMPEFLLLTSSSYNRKPGLSPNRFGAQAGWVLMGEKQLPGMRKLSRSGIGGMAGKTTVEHAPAQLRIAGRAH